MNVNKLLQNINKANYEALDKVIISVNDLMLLRKEIIELRAKVDMYQKDNIELKQQVKTLTGKLLNKTYYKDIREI